MGRFTEAWLEVKTALEKVFEKRGSRLLALASFVAAGAAAWLLPIFTIPGNSLDFWLRIAPWWSYVLLAVFSGLMALLVPMQAYVFKHNISGARKGVGIASVVPAFASTMFSSAACAGCIASLGAFIGGGASLFLLSNRSEVIALGAAFTLASIYYSSKTINRNCASCAAPPGKVGQGNSAPAEPPQFK